MTHAEDDKKGNHTVTLNYIDAVQAIKNIRHFLNKFEKILDKAAIERELEKLEKEKK